MIEGASTPLLKLAMLLCVEKNHDYWSMIFKIYLKYGKLY